MRIYENLFIIKPDATEEEIDGLIDQMSKHVTTAGGTIDKVDKWGKRRLAYRVEKHREGHYVLIQFTAGPEIVKEFERRLRVQDSVIKYLTVRIDETLKRLDKRKKEREKRAHRRPQPPAPQPSLAQQMLGGAAEGAAHPLPGAPAPAAPIAVPAVPAHPVPAQPETAQPESAQPVSAPVAGTTEE
jgi:small subunit ribosomal protein S6